MRREWPAGREGTVSRVGSVNPRGAAYCKCRGGTVLRPGAGALGAGSRGAAQGQGLGVPSQGGTAQDQGGGAAQCLAPQSYKMYGVLTPCSAVVHAVALLAMEVVELVDALAPLGAVASGGGGVQGRSQ